MMPAIARGCATLVVTALLASPEPALAQVPTPQQSDPGRSVVAGRVVDHETSHGIADATIALVRAGADAVRLVRTADEDGRFELEIAPGEYVISVASFGHQPFSDTLAVEADTNVRLFIRMSASPIRLEPVIAVTARRPRFMDGFEERRARDRTHTAFFTADEIEAQNPRVLSDLFTMVPGAYVQPGLMTGNPLGNTLTVGGSSMRGGCTPDVWIDGFLVGDSVPVDEMYPPDQIEAVELYTTHHEVPREFRGPNGCGALVIWLRERGPDEPFLPTWQRWLLALGALGATIILVR